MRLDYAFLAERAARLEDGRLVVFGGDVDIIEPAGFPVLFPTSLVARMILDEGEAPEGHTWGVAITGPNGNRKVVSENQHLNAPQTVPEGMFAAAGLVVGLTLGIRDAGIYKIHLIVDGVELKAIPLKVESPPSQPPQEQVQNDNAITNEANDG